MLKFKWRIKILQQRMLGVFLAQDSVFRRNTPVDAQRIIQDADTAVRFRMIEVVTLVLEDGRFAQYGKTVCKAPRHKKLAMILLRQFHGHMLPVSRTLPLRMSTATSSTAPFTQRTSLLCVYGGRWKCSPRITPYDDMLSLSCTKLIFPTFSSNSR